MLPKPAQQLRFVPTIDLEHDKAAAPVHTQQIDQAMPPCHQMGVENAQSFLDDPGVLQDQAAGNLGILGRTPDDADGQLFSARRTASKPQLSVLTTRGTCPWKLCYWRNDLWPGMRDRTFHRPASCPSDSGWAAALETAAEPRTVSAV